MKVTRGFARMLRQLEVEVRMTIIMLNTLLNQGEGGVAVSLNYKIQHMEVVVRMFSN